MVETKWAAEDRLASIAVVLVISLVNVRAAAAAVVVAAAAVEAEEEETSANVTPAERSDTFLVNAQTANPTIRNVTFAAALATSLVIVRTNRKTTTWLTKKITKAAAA